MLNNKKNGHFILVEDSNALYGIAILFMVFHHLFCLPERLGYDYISVLFGYNVEARVACIAKLCVAIYAFITGYALALKHHNSNTGVGEHFLLDVRVSISTLIKLYSKLWLVCIVFLPIGIVFFGNAVSIKSIIKAFFFGGGYNNEWWYVLQYIKFLLIYPFVNTMFCCYVVNHKNSKIRFIVSLMLCGILFSSVFVITKIFRSVYMFIFISAYFIGKLKLMEIVNEKLHFPNIWNNFSLLLLIILRFVMIADPYSVKIDLIIAPLFIFFTVNMIHTWSSDNVFYKLLLMFGRYSTFIWLTHSFWIYYYFQDIILLPKYSILIYIWTLGICLVNAWILDTIYHKLKIDILVKKMSNNILYGKLFHMAK